MAYSECPHRTGRAVKTTYRALTSLVFTSLVSNVYSCCLTRFLTAYRKVIDASLPLAARKPKLVFPYSSQVLYCLEDKGSQS